jgi:hydrogenase maturation protein HypF
MRQQGIELQIRGIVQGVGFRPFVYRLARQHGLTGTVANTGGGVIIRAEGPLSSLDAFMKALGEEAPPLARITALERRPLLVSPGKRDFAILASSEGRVKSTFISPDVATCDECLRELLDPGDRRHGYPFINCTNCGPRFTVVESIPYDRPKTSMKVFPMCQACSQEYNDPVDRRFHAQPNACRECGPSLAWHRGDGERVRTDEPVYEVIRALNQGRVVAIKGLGGFHLAVDADSERAVALLRERKRRRYKPFAVMGRDLETIHRFCQVSAHERDLLRSPQRPIVLLARKGGHVLAPDLAPGIRDLGVMLPYAPVHHLIMSHPEAPQALVMTSGNLGGEPICTGNAEALERLRGVADSFLLHDLEIVARADDSVVKVIAGLPRVMRRSRGYVPGPTPLPWDLPSLIACGAELKNTFCLHRDGYAFLSPHIGDLGGPQAFDFFQEAVGHLKAVLEIEPEVSVCDLHPDYLSTRYAKGLGLPVVSVQHHHAHAVSVMAEYGLEGDVLAVVLDGAGFGPDGTVWGGEVLLANRLGYQRLGHLGHIMLPGGDAAAREPWRLGISALWGAFGRDGLKESSLPEALRSVPRVKREILGQMLATGLNAPMTSSCGRLFDAVAALLGLRLESEYEGQAAMELESLAWEAVGTPLSLAEEFRRPSYAASLSDRNGLVSLVSRSLIRAVMQDLVSRVPASLIALRFHVWLAQSLGAAVSLLSRKTSVSNVVLAGGCMQNGLLLQAMMDTLAAEGLDVYTGADIPANDGGIAIGQAVIGGHNHVSGHTHACH